MSTATKITNYFIVVDKKSNELIWFGHYSGGGGGYEIPLIFYSEKMANDYFKMSDDFSTEDIGPNGEWEIKKIIKSDLPSYI